MQNLFRRKVFSSFLFSCDVCLKCIFLKISKLKNKEKKKHEALTERNCTDESPSGRPFSVLSVLSPAPFCCRRASWPAGCRWAGTMLVIDSWESLMMACRPLPAGSAALPPSASHKGTHHQNEPLWIKHGTGKKRLKAEKNMSRAFICHENRK